MMGFLNDMAAKQLGKLLASDTTMKVLSNPQVQQVMMKAINMRSEVRETVGKQVKVFASAFDLVTREDVATLKKKMRDMENTIDDLRAELEASHDGPQETTPKGGDEATDAKKPARKRK